MSTFPVPNGCIAAIVTHLQMTAPAQVAAPQLPRGGLALRRVTNPQVDWYLRLYRAVGEANGRNPDQPQYCDACFSGDYPIMPSDKLAEGFEMKTAAE